jgi:hypothetical protein
MRSTVNTICGRATSCDCVRTHCVTRTAAWSLLCPRCTASCVCRVGHCGGDRHACGAPHALPVRRRTCGRWCDAPRTASAACGGAHRVRVRAWCGADADIASRSAVGAPTGSRRWPMRDNPRSRAQSRRDGRRCACGDCDVCVCGDGDVSGVTVAVSHGGTWPRAGCVHRH